MVKSTSGQNLPSAKALRERGGKILFVHESHDVRLTVYENGFFLYEDGDRATVSAVDRCRRIVYRYQDDEVRKIEEAEFRDGPCLIPLLLIGDERVFHSLDNYEWYWHEFSLENNGDDWNVEDKSGSAEDHCIRCEDQNYVKECLEELTPTQRKIVVLYFFENMSEHQIADMVGVSQQAISKTLKGAERKLRKNIEIIF